MQVPVNTRSFDSAVRQLPQHISAILIQIPPEQRVRIHEIRLRAGRPLTVCIGRCSLFVDEQCRLHQTPPAHPLILSSADLREAVRTLCDYSIHTHAEEMRQGYISLAGGSRAGICGTAAVEDGRVLSVGDITSINLRIAREVYGCARPLAQLLIQRQPLQGLLVAGAPGSGKTTLLRDLSRLLAGGTLGRFYKVAVVDERGEIGAVREGVLQCDIGMTADLLFGYPKAVGITTAVRTLSPEVILCDEIATPEELTAVTHALNSGVCTVSTVHAGSLEQLLQRPVGRSLLETEAFEQVVILQGADAPCAIAHCYSRQEVFSCAC